MDLEKLSNEDLIALYNNDYESMSTEGLKLLAGIRSSTIGEDLYSGAMQGLKTGTVGLGLMTSNLLPDGETKDRLFSTMDKAADYLEQQSKLPDNVEQNFMGKLIGVLPQIPAFPFSPGDTGRELLKNNETLDTAISGTLLDTLGNTAGVALPASMGTKLLPKVASGAAMGAGQDTAVRLGISGIAETDKSKEQFKPTWETAALAGVMGGAVGMLPNGKAPKDTVNEPQVTPQDKKFTTEPTPEEIKAAETASVNKSTEQLAYEVMQDHESAFTTSKQIESLRESIAESNQYLSVTKNERKRAEILEKINKKEEILARKEQDFANLERKISLNETAYGIKSSTQGIDTPSIKDVATRSLEMAKQYNDSAMARRAEIVLGRIAEKEAAQMPPEQAIKAQDGPVDVQPIPTPQQQVTQPKNDAVNIEDVNALLDQARAEDRGLAQTTEPSVDQATAVTTKQQQLPFDKSVPFNEVPQSVPAAKPEGIQIRNASPQEAKLVQDIIDSLGLSKENIDIDLGGTQGKVEYTDTGYDVSIPKQIDTNMVTAKGKKFWNSLDPEEAAKFEKAWTIAHELGHVVLNKLLRNQIFDKHIGKLVEDYNKWVKDHPVGSKEAGGILPSREIVANLRDPDYFVRFPEFFAQRVAREMSKSSDTPIGKFVKDINGIWKTVVNKFKLGMRAVPIVDDLIINIMAHNRESIQQAGKSIWEVYQVNETRTPIEAKLRQDDIFGKAVDAALPTNLQTVVRDAETAMQQLLKYARDVGTFSADVSTLFGSLNFNIIPLLQKNLLYDNPLVKYATNVIYEADQNTHARVNKILGGKPADVERRGLRTETRRMSDPESFTEVANMAKDEDFFAVKTVLEAGENRHSYDANLQINGMHLTDFQKKLYKVTTKLLQDTLNEMNTFMSFMGKKSIVTEKIGYLPHIGKGDFVVAVGSGVDYARGIDKEGNANFSDIHRIERFFTEKEAKDFISQYEASGAQGRAQLVGKVPKIDNPFQLDILNNLRDAAEAAGANPKVIEALDAKIQEMIAGGGTIGGHHMRQMSIIKGSKGSELMYSQADQARSFRDGLFEYVHEVSKMIEKQEITTKLDLLLVDERLNSFPGTREFVANMRDYAVRADREHTGVSGKIKEMIDEMYTRLQHGIGNKSYHPANHVYDSAMGKSTHAFYIKFLMSRPSFWVAQASAFTVGFRSLVRNQGILGAASDVGTGFKNLINNDQGFFDFVDWVRENRSTFHPQFVNDLNKFGLFDKQSQRVQKLIGYLTGETPATAADSFSRLLTASYSYAHLKKQGLSGEALYKEAAKLTDENMILYGQMHKAPMYRNMGMVGDLLSPLATFSQAQIFNLAADIKYWSKRPTEFQAALPLLVTVVNSMAMGGVIGMVGAAEVEAIIQGINFLLRKFDYDYQLPTLWELSMGNHTRNEFANRTISHGFVSAMSMVVLPEGMDIGSSNRWRSLGSDIVTGDKNWEASIPVISWMLSVPGSVVDVAKGTVGQERDALRNLLPAYMFGMADTMFYDALNPDSKQENKINNPILNDNPQRALAKFMGTQTIEEHRLKTMYRKEDEMIKTLQSEANKISNKIIDKALTSDGIEEELQKSAEKLAKIYDKDVDQIFSMLATAAINQSTSREDFGGYQKGMEMPSAMEVNVRERVQ